MNREADESIRYLTALSLFIFGSIIGFAMIAWGGLAIGAGHGTSFFYLLASSPGVFLLRLLPDGLANMLLPGLFWPLMFSALTWAHKKPVFHLICISLLLHFAGVTYGCSKENALSGLQDMMDTMPGMVLFALILYLGMHTAILFLLYRARKKLA